MQKLTDSQIVEDYKETLSAYKTAERLGVNWKTVYNALAREGVSATGLTHYRKTARRYSEEQEAEIVALYRGGTRMPAIVKRLGGSRSSVTQVLLRHGVPLRKPPGHPSKLTPEQIADLCERYQAGMAMTALAPVFNTSNETVRKVLIQNGIEIRQRKRNKVVGRYERKDGYVHVRVRHDDPFACMAMAKGFVPEHRLTMARALGRPLTSTETVHHINGDKTDNRPENLQLRQGKHGKHVVMCCLDCGSKNVGPCALEDD